jgi:hypothetical protein
MSRTTPEIDVDQLEAPRDGATVVDAPEETQ